MNSLGSNNYDALLADLEKALACAKDSSTKALLERYKQDALYRQSLLVNGHEPLAIIRTRMEQLNLTLKEVASLFGSKARASQVLNGKLSLSLSTVRQLQQHLQIPVDMLIEEATKDIVSPCLDYDTLPLAHMQKVASQIGLSFFDLCTGWKHERQELVTKWLADCGGISILPQTPVRPRENSTHRTNSEMNNANFSAWVILATKQAKTMKLAPYKKELLTQAFVSELAKLSRFGITGVELAKEELANIGIALVMVPHLPKTYVDGACWLLNDGRGTPVVAISLRYDRLDGFWFTLCHELGHVALHLEKPGQFLSDDHSLAPSTTTEIEREADEFASSCLVSKERLESLLAQTLTYESIEGQARQWNLHPSILAGAVAHETKNWKQWNRLTPNAGLRDYFYCQDGAVA